ncbi:FkbM family methyltransferase [Rhodobaculum claviforme]|uniref:Methyltransferase FkbM n=1 Tax=Rhodobaculum claviforme TaxID=1549854 RepID=A0A934TML7_9RHOB|nr:FkbM family methyltransferase [Rhodobaculum claviforme]MBK5928895.1 methyltransferase FkbM [Rhodobaculum claviforme]
MSSLRTALGLGRSLAIYYGRPWRQRGLADLYRGFLGPGDLAFDIGAHVGNRTRAMRRSGARVVAVEPQGAFAAFLRMTLPGDVTLIEGACGATVGEADLAVSRLHPTVSSLGPLPGAGAQAPGFSHVRWDARQRVSVTTLDALIAAHGLPRLIKIDVEGAEPEVLAGLSQPVPVVAFEYLPALPGPAAAAVSRLEALGPYSFNVVQGEARRFLWDDWRTAAAAHDWLAARAPDEGSGDLYARIGP